MEGEGGRAGQVRPCCCAAAGVLRGGIGAILWELKSSALKQMVHTEKCRMEFRIDDKQQTLMYAFTLARFVY